MATQKYEVSCCAVSKIQGINAIGSKFCAFCTLPLNRVIDESATAIAIRDGYPVSPGHTLLIPRRHAGSFFDLSAKERLDLLVLLDRAKLLLDEEFQPQGYNIGINDGAAAGQTVPHLHVHLIPRFEGDLPDPRGGVRWVIPDKAKYWA
ncbi:MAG: HIT family protein [Burkholderiales bacterium]|jgi:diadenosine tetraphosphate (Ap4A) HIT family hydrolase|nr:HIT family protein [Burkholderiales bacterium]